MQKEKIRIFLTISREMLEKIESLETKKLKLKDILLRGIEELEKEV